MTTAPTLPPISFYEQNAGAYLRSLQSGQMPDIRPDFGPLEALIREAESSFNTLKPEQRPALMPKVLGSISRMKKFRHIDVKGLLEAGPIVLRTEQGEEMPALPKDIQIPPALANNACPWLESYVAYSQQASPEGYADFHEDCGLYVLAAISARRVKIPMGPTGQYTPLSIALVAKPGTYAKSTTAEVAINVLRAAQLDWLFGSDETTPQKLLTDMAGTHVPKQYCTWDEDKKTEFKERKAMSAQVAWYCDEFGELVKSINKSTGPMADLKKLILKFDNCPPVYKTSTQTRGTEEITNPFLSFLGVMTPASIRKSAQQSSEEWGDGFWSRFVFSCAPDDDGLDSPFGRLLPVPPALSDPLFHWHERLGIPTVEIEEIMDKKGEQVVDYLIDRSGEMAELPERMIDHAPIEQYWIRYRSALKKLLQFIPEDLKGSYQRLSTRALRVAALLASFEGLDHIELKHWAKAQEIAERWRRNLHRFYVQVNAGAEIAATFGGILEEKVLKKVEDLCQKGQPPNLRDLVRYIKGPSSGQLSSAVIDLKRVHLLREEKMGKTTRYFPGSEEDG